MTPTTITRPSADVAVRMLRERLTVVAGAVEQIPDGPARRTLECCRNHYAWAIEHLSQYSDVPIYAEAAHSALHVAIVLDQECCITALADVLTVLGGWDHGTDGGS